MTLTGKWYQNYSSHSIVIPKLWLSQHCDPKTTVLATKLLIKSYIVVPKHGLHKLVIPRHMVLAVCQHPQYSPQRTEDLQGSVFTTWWYPKYGSFIIMIPKLYFTDRVSRNVAQIANHWRKFLRVHRILLLCQWYSIASLLNNVQLINNSYCTSKLIMGCSVERQARTHYCWWFWVVQKYSREILQCSLSLYFSFSSNKKIQKPNRNITKLMHLP